jgi:collagen type I/II/III/V/XI/XXIV/XXVII alpha
VTAPAFVRSLGAFSTPSTLASYPFTPTATPAAGNVVLVAVAHRKTSGIADPTGVSWSGFTMTKVDSQSEAGGVLNVSVWVGVPTGAGASGNVTVSVTANSTWCGCQISEWSNVDTTTPVAQHLAGAVTSGTALTITLSSTPTNGAVYGFHAHRAATLTTPGSGFTEIDDQSITTPANTGWESEYQLANDQTVDWTTWTTSSNGAGIALELTGTSTGTTGTGAWTEAPPTIAATGTSTVTGTAAWTEAPPTVAATGTSTVTGTAAWTEAPPTIAATGTSTVTGTAAWTEAPPTVAATGTSTVTGTAAWTEAPPTIAATGTSRVTGTAAWTEAPPTIAGTGTVGGAVPALEDARGVATIRARGTATIHSRAAAVVRSRGVAR